MGKTVLEIANEYHNGGLSVIPSTCDGKKAPALQGGHPVLNRKAKPTLENIGKWFAAENHVGLIVQCGGQSKNLYVIDVEFFDVYEELAALIETAIPGLLAKIPHVRTPGKNDHRGVHLYFHTPTPLAGVKLARMTAEEAKTRTGDAGKRTTIETRGEGQYVIAPGSPVAVHASGRPYEHYSGPQITEAPTLNAETVEVLLSCGRALNKEPIKPTVEGPRAFVGKGAPGLNKPGYVFNEQADWGDLLETYGWTLARRSGAVCYWRRPGKTDPGISATTGHCRNNTSGDLLYVFTTNADPLESDRAYSKFAVFAHYECGKDFCVAARELGRKGYGEPPQIQPLPSVDPSEILPADEKPKTNPDEPEPFPIDVFPPALAEYAVRVARSNGASPVDFPALTMLAAAGAAIGASRALAVHARWIECPRLYLAIVAEPGGSKSPVVDLVMSPITEKQNEWHKQFVRDLEVYEEAQAGYEAGKKAKTANKGGDVPEKPIRPIYRHLYTTDPTTEALVPILVDNPRGLIFFKDELTAWVLSMDQYKGGKGADRQFYLSAWSGASVKTDRKSRHGEGSMIVPKPFVGILGGIQPDMLNELVDSHGREDGFVHRILFSYPKERPWPEAVGEAPAEWVVEAWNDAIVDLIDQYQMDRRESDDTYHPRVLKMTDGARYIWDAWFAAHAREHNDADFPSMLKGPWAKMKSYFVRIALILHCLRQACGEAVGADVDAHSANGAAKVMVYFKAHIRLVQGRLHQTKEATKADKAIIWIDAHGGVCTIRMIQRACFAEKATEAKKLLDDLADRGFGKMTQEDGKTKDGKKHRQWVFRRPQADDVAANPVKE